MNNKNNYFIKHTGLFFPKPIVYIGYIGIVIGILGLTESIILGMLIISLSSFLSFNITGIEIKEKKYRKFLYVFFIRYGKWKTTEKFKSIQFTKKRYVDEIYGGKINISIKNKITLFEIVMFSDNEKVVLLREKQKEKAIESINQIAECLELKII